MMSFRRRILLSALVLCFLAPMSAWAVERYVTGKQIDLTMLLPPPPSPGSAAEQQELGEVVSAQKQASATRVQLAVADNTETVFAMFQRTLGARFKPNAMPIAAVFFARVGESEEATIGAPKKAFGRVRPWIGHPSEAKAMVPPSSSGSYPSGHTTRVTMTAILLAQMLPEHRDEIWARASEYAESRVVGGMHHPRDLAAGRLAGTALVAVMARDSVFQADFAAARAEVRRAMGM